MPARLQPGGPVPPLRFPAATTTTLADGPHTFEVRARDRAGNLDPTPVGRVFTVDTTPPVAPVISDTDPDSPANDNKPEVKGSAEAGSAVRLYESDSCAGPIEALGSAAGFASPGLTATVAGNTAATFTATATDAAGNVSACSATSSYTEDSRAPQTTIVSGPRAKTRKRSAGFGFDADEPGSRFECSLDGAKFAPCSSPRWFRRLKPGSSRAHGPRHRPRRQQRPDAGAANMEGHREARREAPIASAWPSARTC